MLIGFCQDFIFLFYELFYEKISPLLFFKLLYKTMFQEDFFLRNDFRFEKKL